VIGRELGLVWPTKRQSCATSAAFRTAAIWWESRGGDAFLDLKAHSDHGKTACAVRRFVREGIMRRQYDQERRTPLVWHASARKDAGSLSQSVRRVLRER
jgi:hypothetical protein